jgi:hypothetical protein
MNELFPFFRQKERSLEQPHSVTASCKILDLEPPVPPSKAPYCMPIQNLENFNN